MKEDLFKEETKVEASTDKAAEDSAKPDGDAAEPEEIDFGKKKSKKTKVKFDEDQNIEIEVLI